MYLHAHVNACTCTYMADLYICTHNTCNSFSNVLLISGCSFTFRIISIADRFSDTFFALFYNDTLIRGHSQEFLKGVLVCCSHILDAGGVATAACLMTSFG